MNKLKKEVKAEVKEEKVTAKVEESKAESKEKNLTKKESEAIVAQQENEQKDGASTQKMRLATALVSSKFNLDTSYSVTKFDDKGKVINLTMENKDFSLSVTIKDGDRHGLYVVAD